MLKREIKFKDFDGVEVTETHYFNLSRTELLELETSFPDGGIEAYLKDVLRNNKRRELVQLIKDIILRSYGRRSDDNRRFIKSEEFARDFSQSLAFDQLFVELGGDENAAAVFIQGIMPVELVEAARNAENREASETIVAPNRSVSSEEAQEMLKKASTGHTFESPFLPPSISREPNS